MENQVSSGKGDKRRPLSIDDDEMECNWQYAFRREAKNPEMTKRKKKLRKDADE